jgi:hypothetical protein
MRFLSLSPADVRTIWVVSEASRMENCGLKPQQLGLLADDAHAQRVEGAHRQPPGRARPCMWATRSCISLAALLVKVIAAMLPGLMPHSLIRWRSCA